MHPFLSYGLLALAGIILFFLWRPWCAKYPQWQDALPAVILIGTPLALVSSHVVYYLTPGTLHSGYRAFFLTLEGWRAGYPSSGLAIGAMLSIWLASAIHRLPVIELFDLYSPGVFVTSAIWRVGCFAHGCCYGAPTSLPWGVRFTLVQELNMKTPPCHPVQLYEVFISVLILAALPFLLNRFDVHPGKGVLLAVCAFLYSFERFVLEFFRIGGTSQRVFAGMSSAQLVTLVVMIVIVVGGIVCWRRR